MRIAVLITTLYLLAGISSAEEPKELAKLKDTYWKEIEKAKAPVDENYTRALERLLKRLTTEGKLDEALKVREAIARVSEPAAESVPKIAAVTTTEAPPLRNWFGDGRLDKEDGEELLRVEADRVESRRLEQSFDVEDFPEGMRLHVYYRTADYAGTGLKLKSYYNAERDFLYRVVPLIADGEWHEYVYNFEPTKYRGAFSIRWQLELLGGTGMVEFKGLKVTSL